MPTSAPSSAAETTLRSLEPTAVLFDLDGTISDSGPVITQSIAETLAHFGYPVPTQQELLQYVGPPIRTGFATYAGIPAEQLEEVVSDYRVRYNARMLQAPVFDGVTDLITDLHARGIPIALATSKRLSMARVVLEDAGLTTYFTAICGASEDESRAIKPLIVEDAIAGLHAAAPTPRRDPVGLWHVGGAATSVTGVDLPVMPPVPPMLARSVKQVPAGDHLHEPKWDGFRALIFRDGDEVEITSRNQKPITRYFPELVAAALESLPPRCVVDGEIIAVAGDRLDFDLLSQRIHPAKSRVKMLSVETPASFVAFDLLALDDEDLTGRPLVERRAQLEKALAGATPPFHLTRVTRDVEIAREWLDLFEGAGLDGVVSKPLDGPYEPGKRAMLKTKHERTADCVVAGFRWHKSGPVVGSLLLGLYDEGRLQHVGVVAAFSMKRREELVAELEPLRAAEGEDHPWEDWQDAAAHEKGRLPGAQSRWSGGKDLSFVPLRPELVVEVAYDHMEGTRFRHTAQFRRWRPDRTPESCTYTQLDEPVNFNLADVLT